MRAQKVVRREAGAKGLKLDGAQMLARMAELAGENGGDQAAKEARLGEMLECLCALAEAQGLDAETALRGQTKNALTGYAAKTKKPCKTHEIFIKNAFPLAGKRETCRICHSRLHVRLML